MTDLHEQLTAAVTARLDMARAALAEPGTSTGVVPAISAWRDFYVANDPATILRHCQRDLRVLERHKPTSMVKYFGLYEKWWCRAGHPWPCAEIRDLATAYGIDPP